MKRAFSITITIILGALLLVSCNKPAAPQSTGQPASPPEVTTSQPESTQSPSADEIKTGVDIGEQLPDFTLTLRTGETVTLSEMIGKPVLLNLSTTWCPPCQIEFPEIQKIYDDYGESIYVLIVSSREKEADVDAYFDKSGFTFPVAYDPTGSIFGHYYTIEFIPQTWILDKNGVVVDYIAGAGTVSMFSQTLDKLLSQVSQ